MEIDHCEVYNKWCTRTGFTKEEKLCKAKTLLPISAACNCQCSVLQFSSNFSILKVIFSEFFR